TGARDYAAYLALDRLLALQEPQSRPIAADEILFISVHQISELWFKLVLHELSGAIRDFAADRLLPAAKHLARTQAIFRELSGVWEVLETLTPSDYQAFRPALGQASGSGSFQFHAIEYALGYRESGDPNLSAYPEATRRWLMGWYEEPSLYEAFVGALGRLGYPVPRSVVGDSGRSGSGARGGVRDGLSRAACPLGGLRGVREAHGSRRGHPALAVSSCSCS
ncbi:tryptophan 2,3-dioxygenase, partial [mine drainage metagenome]